MPKILGIDLGTTNSVVAVIEGGQPKVLENAEGSRTTPSMVAISKTGELLVGLLAKRQAVTNHENTISSVKRLIGRRWEDTEVQRDVKVMPYKIQKAGEGVEVVMNGKPHSPQQISAFILQKLKADAEARLGEKVEEAVITVPAYFDDSQRQATKDAGEIAGLKVRRIINEPTAAALAYGFDKKKDQKIAVYDLGGGTFDVSVLDISADTVEVKATNGDTHLGGDDFDQRVMKWIFEEFKKESGVDVSNDPMAMQRLKEAAEKAKIELSSALETEINQPFITAGAQGPMHLLLKLSRAKLEELVHDLVQATLEPCRKALADAHLEIGDIDEIIMVGGMTRMPLVLKTVEEFFGKKLNVSVNPDEVVAIGAAVQAGILQGDVKDVLLLDVTPLSLGLETLGGVRTVLIPRNTTVPTSKSEVFSTAADNQTSVEIHVLQGEREMAGDNKSLGKFILSGIPPAPRGTPQVEVMFDIDANGILKVSAKDKATAKEQSITITASSALSKEEIERMKKDAELHAEEDRTKRELVDARNMAESVIATAERSLTEAGDKVPAEVKTQVEAAIESIKKVKDGDDAAAIRREIDAAQSAIGKIGEAMYKSASAESSGGPAAGQAEPATENAEQKPPTVEAEFEEKKSD